MSTTSLMPERIVIDLINAGVTAIKDDLAISAAGETILDDILKGLTDEEKTKARTFYAEHPPSVILGYARTTKPFPMIAVTLGADNVMTDYLGMSEHAAIDELLSETGSQKEGRQFSRRVAAKFVIYIYSEHPDVCAWYYRVTRRILNVGFLRLIEQGLDEPKLDGADLAPDPRFVSDIVFVRRLTLSVDYDEEWGEQDRLFAILNPNFAEPFITEPDQISVSHEDVGGGIQPRFDIQTLDQSPDTWDAGC